MRIHLITILYNSADALPAFLDSLKAQSFHDWRLIAIDNASPDGAGDIAAASGDDRITVVRNASNLGFAKAANQGLREAARDGGEFFVLFNNDTVFGPEFLADFVAARDRLQAQVIAPRIMRLERPDKAWYAGGHLDQGWVFRNIHEEYDPHDTRTSRMVDFASGCCLGLTRHLLERIGLFDESFFVYWEDTDFCLRLKEAGIPIVYVREPSILHAGGAASGGEGSTGYNRLFYRSYVQFLRKHFGVSGAARTVLRLVLREAEEQNRNYGAIARMTVAMLQGMVAPLVRESRLQQATSGKAH